MLQRCACGGRKGPSGECAACRRRRALQPKLTVGAPGDRYEREADRLAETVMAAPADAAPLAPPVHVQRAGHGAEAGVAGTEAPASIDAALAAPGRPLDAGTRSVMEARLGHDFSRVRVHTGARAAASASDVGARAYTVGHDVVFGAGQFAPGTLGGRRLLAHELTHVVQQREAAPRAPGLVQRQADGATEAMSEDERQRLVEAMCPQEGAEEGPRRCEFTDRQMRRVLLAQSRAWGLASKAALGLGSGDRYIRRMARRMFDRPAIDADAIARQIDAIRDALSNAPIRCGTCADDTCRESAAQAYVPDDFSAIVICPRFFLSSPSQRIRTLLHEAGHSVRLDDRPDYEHPQNCVETDRVLCDDPCAGVSDRLRNVDVWARFIECAGYSW